MKIKELAIKELTRLYDPIANNYRRGGKDLKDILTETLLNRPVANFFSVCALKISLSMQLRFHRIRGWKTNTRN